MNPKIKRSFYELLSHEKYYQSSYYIYRVHNDKKHLLNEIGVLRGLEEALRILNIGIAHIEFMEFIEIQQNLLKK